MTEQESDYVIQIKHLVAEGKYEAALDDIEIIETNYSPSSSDSLRLKVLQGEIYSLQGEFEKALEHIDEFLNSYKYLGSSLIIFDSLIIKSFILANIGKIREGFDTLDSSVDVLSGLTANDEENFALRKAQLHFHKGLLYEKQQKKKIALEQYLLSLSILRELDNQPGIARSLEATARIYFSNCDVIRAQLIFEQALEIYKELGNELKSAFILNNLGEIYTWKGDYGLALEQSLQSLAIAENMMNDLAIAQFLFSISKIFCKLGELNRAIEYLERSLSIFEENNNREGIARVLNLLAESFYRKGEIDQAANYVKQSSSIWDELNNKLGIAAVNETTGKILLIQGDISQAITKFQESLAIREENDNPKQLSYTLFWLILASLENNSLQHLQDHLQRIQKILEKENNAIMNQIFELASAAVLKSSNKREFLQKAKRFYLKIIDGVLLDHELKVIALYSYCELLIKLIELFHEKDEIQMLDNAIGKHFEIAKNIESQTMIAENFWLKAQLSLIRHKYQDARNYLQQARQITEDKGYKKLAMEIPRMQKIIDSYFDFDSRETEETVTSLERKITTPVNDDVMRLVNKRSVDMPKLQDEEPVLLIIVYEGGVTIFSRKFSQKEMIDEMFVGGFLTAIDAFMHQTFATGGSIERIKHQEYTLLLKAETPLLFCYVYKGQSFSAIQKLDKVIDGLKNTVTIWHALKNNPGEQLSEKEKEFIDNLAERVFINKE